MVSLGFLKFILGFEIDVCISFVAHLIISDPSLIGANSTCNRLVIQNDRAHSSIVLDCVRLQCDHLRVVGGPNHTLDHKKNPNE